MDISIIIVSYNTKTLLAKCLDSLRAAIAVEKEIFVVDNCSSDGSAAMVKELYPEVRLIANSANRGFGAANNQPLADCRGDYVLYLNPDTEVAAGAIAAAVSYMRAHSQTGLAGARITNPDGSLQESVSYRYPNEKYAGRETASLAGKIACVLGAFMIARKDIIDELKGFDEDFFAYEEDVDLSLRLHNLGYTTLYVPEALSYHLGGATSSRMGNFRHCMDAKNWIYIILKNYSTTQLLIYFPSIFIERLRNISGLIKNTPFKDIPRDVFKTYFEVIRTIPKILKKRYR